ncbi:MAG: ribonuclease III [Pseudomonadales bacterium]|nr:ribonuclease III [Pseudomonadales bacterium]MDP6471681.1 ribonuclease III [Pseudomonadales bacterium]MDP6970650.1 ribonuclease III [Pseudomonadales bacterium]
MARSYECLETALAYQFADQSLLRRALTHKSASAKHNERLEFLGDAVLGYVVADYLHGEYPDQAEDLLTLLRASLVRGTTLAEVAREIDLGAVLNLGTGARKSGGHHNMALLANALEAVIGAVHQDGGIGAARAVVVHLLGSRFTAAQGAEIKDTKTRLQEWLQARKHELPVYQIERTEGQDHERRFFVSCVVAELDIRGEGIGSSRKEAEKVAARAVLDRLESEG